MKTVFEFARLAGREPKGWMACFVLVMGMTAGCGKSDVSAPSAPPPMVSADSSVSTVAVTAPTPQPMQAVMVRDTDDSKKQLQSLNRALMGWMIRNHRHPKTFGEFASTANFQVPAPPAGKKYTLNDRGFIVLVDNSSN